MDLLYNVQIFRVSDENTFREIYAIAARSTIAVSFSDELSNFRSIRKMNNVKLEKSIGEELCA